VASRDVQSSKGKVIFLSFLAAITWFIGLPAKSEAQGLATRYPRDIGIESDPAVVFTENFEEAALGDVVARWDDTTNVQGMSLVPDTPPPSSGRQSLQMNSVIGQNTGGHLYKSFPAGYETLYARFYVKLASDCHPVHHFVHMGGYNPPTRWPQGGAGVRPDGTERFTTGIEPMGSDWRWDFYTYWMHMRGNPGGPEFWGNSFNPTPIVPVQKGEWICVEFMMTCNNPLTAYNGEQAFWINGAQAIHLGEGFPNGYWVWDTFHPDPGSPPFEGFQWRIADALKVNFFWLLFYMTDGNPGQADTVFFDDIVLATEYIGPIFTPSATIRLLACRCGSDVCLFWNDAGQASYSAVRGEDPQFLNRLTIFQGSAFETSDTGAIRMPSDFFYRIE